MASSASVHSLRTFPRRIVVVCCPAPLRQYRRIRRADSLLLFPLSHQGERSVAFRAGDHLGLGGFWDHLHGDRRSPHPLRAAGSGSLELAKDCAARNFARDRRRGAVLADRSCPHGARLSALCGPGEAARRIRDLDGGLPRSLSSVVRVLFLPSACIRRELATRRFLGSYLEGVRDWRRLSRSGPSDGARLSRTCPHASGRISDIRRVAANSILRKYCTTPGWGALCRSRHGASAYCRRGISARSRSLPFYFCLRSDGRLAGDKLPAVGPGLHPGVARNLYRADAAGAGSSSGGLAALRPGPSEVRCAPRPLDRPIVARET